MGTASRTQSHLGRAPVSLGSQQDSLRTGALVQRARHRRALIANREPGRAGSPPFDPLSSLEVILARGRESFTTTRPPSGVCVLLPSASTFGRPSSPSSTATKLTSRFLCATLAHGGPSGKGK